MSVALHTLLSHRVAAGLLSTRTTNPYTPNPPPLSHNAHTPAMVCVVDRGTPYAEPMLITNEVASSMVKPLQGWGGGGKMTQATQG